MERATPIKFLQSPTSRAWVEQARSNLDLVLLDHAQCERKAAGVALSFINRYPSDAGLVKAMTAIAQEGPLPPPPYGARLREQVRPDEPYRLLDLLLVSALIEARSHERLGLLAENCADPALAQFYRELTASEARHYGAYWVLACGRFDVDQVEARLLDIAQVESEILSSLHPEARIHS